MPADSRNEAAAAASFVCFGSNFLEISIFGFPDFQHEDQEGECHKGHADNQEEGVHRDEVLTDDEDDIADEHTGSNHDGDGSHDRGAHAGRG